MKIRHLPAQEQRIETGPVQFGDDWPGIFIRGDDAFAIRHILSSPLADLAIEHVEQLLKQCDMTIKGNL